MSTTRMTVQLRAPRPAVYAAVSDPHALARWRFPGGMTSLVPDELVVQVDEFDSDDPAVAGEMTLTLTLLDHDGGTELTAVHEGVPDAVDPAANELGWRMALERLAALVEA